MTGRGTISVNQSPQHGDKTALESASKAITKTPMTGNPTPAPSAGRPVSSGAGVSQAGNALPVQQAPPQTNVSPEHKAMLQELAQAFRTQQFWLNVLAQYPSEWSRMYAQDAERSYQRIQQKTRANTPYFE